MNSNILRNKYIILAGIFIVATLFWYGIFKTTQSQTNSGPKIDQLSNTSYNMTAINSDIGPNPYAPYFVGFNKLRTYGASDNTIRYTEDVLINYTLYDKHLSFARISYVDNSLTQPSTGTTAIKYSFKVGFNNTSLQKIDVISDIVTNKITVTVYDSSSHKAYNKSFTMYDPGGSSFQQYNMSDPEFSGEE